MPIGVLALDQIDLPLPSPVLELFLARDGRRHVPEHFVANQTVDFVATGKAGKRIVTMLPKPADKIAGESDVRRAERHVGQDVDTWVTLKLHGSGDAARWTLKQVQGDGEGKATHNNIRHAELVSASIPPHALMQLQGYTVNPF